LLEQYIQLGQRIDLESVTRIMADGEPQQLRKVYSSKVYEILSEEKIEILMPYEQRRVVLLPVDSEYSIYFYTENGMLECKARIVDRYKSNNVFILVMELLTNLRKYQRREFYRYNCVLELESRVLEEDEKALVGTPLQEFVQDLPLQKSVIVDISGGGLRFLSNENYKEGSLLFCRYQLEQKDNEKVYEVIGKVLSAKPASKRPGFYEYRIQYQHIDNKKREEIIQYIFEEERKNRKKEKGLI